MAYILETLSYAITLTYSVKNDFPFSTYGENLFLTIQDVLITLLIIAFSPSSFNKPRNLALALIATAGTTYVLHSLPLSALAAVQASTLPLSLFSKLPQIVQNAQAESTGQLSAVAVLAQILGCIARLFTTATEVNDTLVLSGFALALALNLVLGSQMWMYWGRQEVKSKEKKAAAKAEVEREEVFSPQVEVEKPAEQGKTTAYEALGASPQPVHRLGTPPPRSFSPAGSQRKWARKTVD
jgi:mannose-P-dolichol utilization defect protein 1